MNSWSNRIKERMKVLGLTQEELAKRMGITRGAIAHYLAERRIPPLSQFKKLAAILKTDPAWLHYGSVAETSAQKKDKTTSTAKKPIPILSWEKVANFLAGKQAQHEDAEEFVPHIFSDMPCWYALRIKSDAMTAQLGSQVSFREGDIIIIDPEKTPIHGSFIVALLPRAKEVTFKQYVVDGGITYLKPLNPQYPLMQIDESTYISGVVVQHLIII